jgi:hypothetical protein
VTVSADGRGLVSQAGAVLLQETMRVTGLGLVVVDLDATIVIAHSDKEQAAPTWKKTFGFHPVTAWADHGQAGNGEPRAIPLRPGNAGPSLPRPRDIEEMFGCRHRRPSPASTQPSGSSWPDSRSAPRRCDGWAVGGAAGGRRGPPGDHREVRPELRVACGSACEAVMARDLDPAGPR